MKVAVITPYFKEPLEMLRRAHESVTAQTHSCTHYMIADGYARPELDNWDVRHIALPGAHDNNGNTPRAIGSLDAMADDFDAIAYLDADNWFDPNHIESLVEKQKQTKADFVTSGRVIHGIEGTILLPNGEEGDGGETADTSTLMFMRPAFSALSLWGTMPNELSPNCDRFIFKGVQALGCRHAHTAQPTLHFTSRYAPHYRVTGVDVPEDATAMHAKKDSDQFARRLGASGLSHVLSGRDVASWFAQKASAPIIVFIVGDEEKLSPQHAAFCDALEAELHPESEFYFASAEELLTEETLTQQHNNCFAVYFEGSDAQQRSDVERTAQDRGDIAVVYVRTYMDHNANVETLLDRYAWRVVVPSEGAATQYHLRARYGRGHVVVSELTNAPKLVVGLMTDYAR